MDRLNRLSPLGATRLRILDCMGGNSAHAPGYFNVAVGDDVFGAFRQHVAELTRGWAAASNPLAISLLAAARLLIGEVAAAEVILDHLPSERIKLDHGAGICLLVPLQALRHALPLPGELSDVSRWLANSSEQALLRNWLARHRDELRWHEIAGNYGLAEAG